MIKFNKTSVTRNESDACKACTSRCCDNMPGIVFPEQLKEINIETVTELLNSGYCLDWWEGDPRMHGDLPLAYYIRPRIVGFEDKTFHPAWHGTCIFLTPTGCKHKFQDRPLECQALMPNSKTPGHGCKSQGHYAKKDAALAWIPYQNILKAAGDAVRNKQLQHESI